MYLFQARCFLSLTLYYCVLSLASGQYKGLVLLTQRYLMGKKTKRGSNKAPQAQPKSKSSHTKAKKQKKVEPGLSASISTTSPPLTQTLTLATTMTTAATTIITTTITTNHTTIFLHSHHHYMYLHTAQLLPTKRATVGLTATWMRRSSPSVCWPL
jgi:hypothetical protein